MLSVLFICDSNVSDVVCVCVGVDIEVGKGREANAGGRKKDDHEGLCVCTFHFYSIPSHVCVCARVCVVCVCRRSSCCHRVLIR